MAPFGSPQGFHNKIVESLVSGIPVLSQTSRAAAGIGLGEHQGLFTADSPDGFAHTVDFVLTHPELRQDLRKSLDRVRERLSWNTRLRKLDEFMSKRSSEQSWNLAQSRQDGGCDGSGPILSGS